MAGSSVSTFSVSVQTDLKKHKACMLENMASKRFISYSSKWQQFTLNYTGTLEVSLSLARTTNIFVIVKEYKTTRNCQQRVSQRDLS